MLLSSNRLSHAYIVRAGVEALPSSAALAPEVMALISEMLCNATEKRPCGVCAHCDKVARGTHPDITIISRLEGKKDIQVDQIREAVFGARLLPNEAERRVIIISPADEMNANAQNALLKLLEEPPKHIALLLITKAPGALLATVRSRCRVFEACGEAVAVPEDIKALAARYVELAIIGGQALVELSFKLESIEKRDFATFLSEARGIASSRLRQAQINGAEMDAQKRAREIITVTIKAEEFLNRNVSTMHISALLCAFS